MSEENKLLVMNYANYKGIQRWHTGGGCEALHRDIGEDSYCLITDEGGDIPWSLDEPECMLGLYNNDDVVEGIILFEGTAQQCIDMLGAFG